MHNAMGISPELVIGLALAVGLLAQIVARHLRIPGIALLLAVGVALGPDGADLIRPELLGPGLETLVGFAVAIVLFEGGMSLNFRALRREARNIRRLVTLGAAVTAVGGAVAARYAMGWDWRVAALFGTLVVVTGPTVINPILRRIHVQRELQTILEAEGIFIDAVGALAAVVTLEFVIQPPGADILSIPTSFLTMMGFGILLGGIGGGLIALGLHATRNVRPVPEGLENVFTLAMVLALFQISNATLAESGIVTAIVAGLAVGNLDTPVHRDLLEFKEQLTVLVLGLIFVLLAADVRLADVRALGLPGVVTVAALMLVVRPLNVLVSTMDSELDWRQKTFLSWLAPRGIVAAAVASLFAETLAHEGIPGGVELRALVFSVVATTVVIQGVTAGPVAGLLGLRRPTQVGHAIFGASACARMLGHALAEGGEAVVMIDTNPVGVGAAEAEGLRVVQGNALEERALRQAELELRATAIAATANDEVNLLFAQKARQEYDVGATYVAVHRGVHVNRNVAEEAGADILFGGPVDIEAWSHRARRGRTLTERWILEDPDLALPDAEPDGVKPGGATYAGAGSGTGKVPLARSAGGASPAPRRAVDSGAVVPDELLDGILPLTLHRGDDILPVGHRTEIRPGDSVILMLDARRQDELRTWLADHGWRQDS